MKYSIYETVRSGRYENSVMFTYGINIKFYESVLWLRLYRNGCHNNLLFVDGNQYSNSLMQEKNIVKHLGTGFTIYPIYSLAAFHPKIILLTTKNTGKLIIGSANITVSAFTRNREIVNEFDFIRNKKEEYLYLFYDCWNYIVKTTENAPQFIKEQLNNLFEKTPWLEKEGNRKKNITFISSNPQELDSEERLIDVIKSTLGTNEIREMNVLSPFFDSDFRILESLRKKFSIHNINIIIDIKTTLNPSALPIIKKKVKFYKFIDPEKNNSTIVLHGKLFHFSTDKGDFLLVGSMNFSSRALGANKNLYNYEAGIIYKVEDINYFDVLGLSKMINEENKLNIDDLCFIEMEDNLLEKKDEIIINWVESFFNTLDIYFYKDILEKIKKITLNFYSCSDTVIKKIKIRNYRKEFKKISIFELDTKVLEASNFVKLDIEFQDESILESNKTVINKVELLQEAITKTGIVRTVKELSRAILLDKDDEKIFNLLQTCIFDVYSYELQKNYLPKSTQKSKERDNINEIEGKLEEDDIISKGLTIKERLTSNGYIDYSGNLVKDIFLDIFLRKIVPVRKHYTEVIVDEFEQEKNTVSESEIESEIITQEPKHLDVKKKTTGELKNHLLKNFINKYRKHINLIENYHKEINLSIENEFVRHYAFFWLTLKTLKENEFKYNFTFNDFIWSNLYFVTSLINKIKDICISDYVKNKKYLHEEGFYFGTCSLLAGFYMIDNYMQGDIRDRFRAYEKRKSDFIFIINKLLILTFLLQLGSGFFSKTAKKIISKNYENIHKYIPAFLYSFDFNYILSKVEETLKIIESLKTSKSNFKSELGLYEIKRGDLIMSKRNRICLVKKVKSNSLEVYYGINTMEQTNRITNSFNKQQLGVKIENSILKKYFFELLEPNNSNWDLLF